VTRTPAAQARALVAQGRTAALATTGPDGSPWASLVLYAPLGDGTPILCLSTLAEHGRNVARDPRVSLLVAEPEVVGDPLDRGRVTLAGRLEPVETEEARAAYEAAAPAAIAYGAFSDFTFYALRAEQVRWVGGYGRMASIDAAAYHAA
jgi:putative heme iron utilization protein